MGLYSDLLLIRTLHLVPFARYSASKILVCDLDLSESLKVKYFIFFSSSSSRDHTGDIDPQWRNMDCCI